MSEEKISHLKAAERVLKEASKSLTVREIWKVIERGDLISVIRGNNPAKTTLSSLLGQEFRKNPEGSIFVKDETERPTRWALKSFGDKSLDVRGNKKPKHLEENLHPVLTSFVAQSPNFCGENTVYTKTISANKSRGKYNAWVFPDMVGVLVPFKDFPKNVLDLAGRLGANSIFKLFAFELKLSLDAGNYRECFFQAVSNSSWANEGYLVAKEISQDREFLSNLERLSNSFGIGVIRLDMQNVFESEIVFPAESSKELDWATIGKMCDNPDFNQFIDNFNDAIKIGNVSPVQHDNILDEDGVTEHIRDKFGIASIDGN